MNSIRYTQERILEIPDAKGRVYGKAAEALYNMCIGQPAGTPVSWRPGHQVTEEADRFVSLKELMAVLALEIGEEELGAGEFRTSPSWPFDIQEVFTRVPVHAFMDSLFEYGNADVRISPLGLLRLASCNPSEDALSDEGVVKAACAFYSSFDERFQALFYPSSYCLQLASDSACLFDLSSAISKIASVTKIYSISPTSLWLGMLVQEPVPSLLYDFLSKTKQSTGIRDDMACEEEGDANTMSEMVHLYIDTLLPTPANMGKISFTDDMLRIVEDAMVTEAVLAPASVASVVVELLVNQGKTPQEINLWVEYCERVGESCDFSDVPMVYYPDFTVLTPSGIVSGMKMLSDDNAPIRRVLSSSALLSFLDESLAGGAPDVSYLNEEELAAGAKAIEYENKEIEFAKETLTFEEIEVLQNSRKLSHFGVPLLFQQLIIANMISRSASTVDVCDIIRAIDPTPPVTMLSPDVSPYAAHAGVNLPAAMVLAVVEAMMRRMSMTMMLDQNGAMRLYSSFLSTVAATYQAAPDMCCSHSDQWLISCISSSFDPRVHVFFSPQDKESPQLSWSVPLSIGPGSQGTSIVYPMPAQSGGDAFNQQSNPMPYLSSYGTDMVALAKEGKIGEGIVGRDDTIALVETVLARRDKSNPLLLAPAGAGKSAIAEGIAARIAKKESELLNQCGLYQVDLTSIVADGCSPAVMSERIEMIVQEAIQTNTILFIDEIHMMVSVGHGEMNVGNVMKPYLARGGLKLIGATTEREYNYTIAKDKALSRRFSPLHLPELPFDALMNIIDEKKKAYGEYHGVEYADKTARSVILLAKDYMSGKESPDRELDIVDTAASVANKAGDKVVEESHIVEAVKLLTSNRSVKTTSDIAKELVGGEYTKERLDEIFPNVAGQYQAKETIARKVFESKLDIAARPRPKNVMMFVGDSGVGKTYMAHEMAGVIDASDSDVLSINLSEYQDYSTTRLTGANPQYVGYQEGGILTNFVMAHPHGIVILDEMDKTNPAITQLFLGVFDTGEIRAGDGNLVDCRSITFVCTANTGHGASKQHALGFATVESAVEAEKEKIRDALVSKFGEPLLARMDEIVIFEELTDDDYVNVCKISYRRLADKLFERHEVDITSIYTEEDLETDVRKKLDEMLDKDARQVWAEMEKEIIPKAISLLG